MAPEKAQGLIEVFLRMFTLWVIIHFTLLIFRGGKMQLKIGASAEIDVTVNADGDILVQIIDKEALSDQGAHVAIHPQALTQAISKLAGGNATLSGLLSYVVPVLIGLLPKA